MKKLLLIAVILVASISAHAQTVNDIPVKDIDVDYFMIIGSSNFSGTKMKVQFDFGQSHKFLGTSKNMVLKDENGKPMLLNSMVDALNFVSEFGYKFQTWETERSGDKMYYGILVKKKRN